MREIAAPLSHHPEHARNRVLELIRKRDADPMAPDDVRSEYEQMKIEIEELLDSGELTR